MLSNLFAQLGWTRDDAKWAWTIAIAVIVGLSAALVDDKTAAFYGFPVAWLPRLRGLALVVGIIAAAMKTSGLPPGRLRAVLLAVVLAGASSWGCASLPAKQRAVVSLQASETALEAAHDAERALCSPTSDQAKPIRHCDGAAAVALGLTDARHQQLAGLYVQAFDIEIKAATALKLWRAGDPVPQSFQDYRRVLDDILGLIGRVIPRQEAAAAKAQAAVDAAATVAAAMGVK